jgi:hypothetical protein
MVALFPVSIPAKPSAVLEVRAEDGYLVGENGRRIDRGDIGRRLRVMNVEEVFDLELEVAGIVAIPSPIGQLWALHLERPEPGSRGGRLSICKERSDGRVWLIPIAGRLTARGELNRSQSEGTLACASGALGKCLELGFAPWLDSDHFAACTRMVRADYCGDGRAHTRAGIQIAFNHVGANGARPATPSGYRFEALWRPDGAHCVEATRVAELFTIEDLTLQCPERNATLESCRTSRTLGEKAVISTAIRADTSTAAKQVLGSE